MLRFSNDPNVAESQMHAVIFFLTTFGYIDGDFDQTEKSYVRTQIQKLVTERVESAISDAAMRVELIDKYTRHFHEVFEGIDQRVKDLLTEPVAAGEDQATFVHTKLKQQCFEILQSFDRDGQEQLLSAIDELIVADGEVHPAEVKFRAEMSSLLEADLGVELVEEAGARPTVRVTAPMPVPKIAENHPFFDPFERHYSSDKKVIAQQIAADRALLDRALAVIDEQRKRGAGRLAGKKSVAEIPAGEAFLDGHTYVLRPRPGKRYDLLVLGDLHGCYSVLKAAILQSKFFDKVNAFRADPENNPEPKLILLGDYIDRGLFSLNGVFRTVLQLFVTAPDFVYPLRGNHEYYIEHQGKIYGGVSPSESINTLKPLVPMDAFRHYKQLFESIPNFLLFDQILFVHAGIPRDREIKAKWRDLSSLNDPDIRFQMMWSDPSKADVIPADLQDKSSRFAFGKLQFRAFMQKLGCHTMVRGHEKVAAGIERVYDGDEGTLLTLFSAGGNDNDDLPENSGYRTVTPMALSITHGPEGTVMTPWAPDYRAYNDPERNAFFKVPPEIEHRT
jgi:uncharacterized tellurite resistance protein B-like protein